MQQGCVPWSNPPPSFPHLLPSRILESHPLVHNEPMSLLSLLFLIHMADFPVHDSLVERLRSPESWSFFLSVSDGSSATSSQFKRCPNFCIQHSVYNTYVHTPLHRKVVETKSRICHYPSSITGLDAMQTNKINPPRNKKKEWSSLMLAGAVLRIDRGPMTIPNTPRRRWLALPLAGLKYPALPEWIARPITGKLR